MLAEMLDYCSAGESTIAVFAYLFLQHLPKETPMLLSEDNPADMQAIADKANRLITMHVPQGHDACAAVAVDKDLDVSNLVATTQGARWKSSSFQPPSVLSSSGRARDGRLDAHCRSQDQQVA
jgi:hypothetical protein